MAVPKWGFIAFLVLLSLSICSSNRLHQPFPSIPTNVDTNKADEADHHDSLKAQNSHNNIDVKGFGGGGGGGFGIGGGGSFGIGGGGGSGIGGGGSFGIGGGGGWGGGGGIGGGGGSNTPNYGCGIRGCGTPGGFTIPGYGTFEPEPVFDGCPPGCGYVCPANNPRVGMTEFHISGLSQYTGPYKCRPDITCDGEHCNGHELVLHFVSPMQLKHENQRDQRTVERSEEDEADRHSEQHKDDDIIN